MTELRSPSSKSNDEECEPLTLRGSFEIGDNRDSSHQHYQRGRSTSRLFLALFLVIGAVLGIALLRSRRNTSTTQGTTTTVSTNSIADDISDTFVYHKPTLNSGVQMHDDAFKLALEEIATNIDDEGIFMAGAGWSQLWTRDSSYAIQLSLGLLYPNESKQTLETCTENVTTNKQQHASNNNIEETVWLQDKCGHFKGWPNLSDAIVGVQGSWSLYLATGDQDFLLHALAISKRSLARAERDVFDHDGSLLFKGCSSFMESNSGYPVEYKLNGTKVGQTKALSTNVLYYLGYKLSALMTKELLLLTRGNNRSAVSAERLRTMGIDRNDQVNLEEKAKALASAIHSRLWMQDKGYYAYFEDDEENLVAQMEGLGESLLLLAPDLLAPNQTARVDSIFQNTHITEKGLPCLWPPFEGQHVTHDVASYYHNARIWPFVQSYWALAAAFHKKVDIFATELTSLAGLAQSSKTFAEFYELNGTHLDIRKRQLWSSAGYMGMILYGLFGIQLTPRGIGFRPVKPASIFHGDEHHIIELENLIYRKARLAIHISGNGHDVKSCRINGENQNACFLDATSMGDQLVEITLI